MVELSIEEAVKLGAVNTELFCQTFFPKTFRQKSPPFAQRQWEALEDPNARLLELMSFRGSAKTTRMRTFAAKRISYGISRTILIIGASERDAIRSVQWLRGQVDRNTLWRETFGLRQGKKWEETQIEIEHATLEHPIWILAAGITGSLRGINFDDYRPDLIIVDDPQTDEMAASREQRESIKNLLLGAVRNSLAPAVDEPNAKLIMAVTPQHPEDVALTAMRSSSWTTLISPCWTADTMHLGVDQQVSVWEDRFPTEDLRKQKLEMIQENKLSVFAREMECRIVSPETSSFKAAWLQFYERPPAISNCVLAIDPVPPPSEVQIAKGLVGKDFECQAVWGRANGQYYLMDYVINRGHEPSWSVAKCFELARRYRVFKIVVESTAYQRTLKWMIEKEMQRRGIYYPVVDYKDRRAKFARITGTLSPLATQGLLWVNPLQSEFISQFENYPNVDHDDILDACSIALSELVNPFLEAESVFDDANVENFPKLIGACP